MSETFEPKGYTTPDPGVWRCPECLEIFADQDTLALHRASKFRCRGPLGIAPLPVEESPVTRAEYDALRRDVDSLMAAQEEFSMVRRQFGDRVEITFRRPTEETAP